MSATNYILVVHHDDGPRVTDFATKRAAHAAGMALRAQGVTCFAYAAADATKHGLDPRAAS